MPSATSFRRDPTRSRPRPRVEALEGRMMLSGSGTLDSTFGAGHGYVQLPLGIVPNGTGLNAVSVQSVALEPGGQIVVEGSTSQQVRQGTQLQTVVVPSLTRFNADGTVDTTFGNQGHVIIPANFSMIIQPLDGKIVVYGGALDGGGNATYDAIRLTTTGTLDTTYGTNGVAEYPANTTTPVANRLGNPVAAVSQTDGKLVLVGSFSTAVRLNTDGSLDTTYGVAGTTHLGVTFPGTLGSSVVAASIQSDGGVVVVGNVNTGTISLGPAGTESAYEVAAVRITSNGSLDLTYGNTMTRGKIILAPDPANPTTLGINKATSAAVDPVNGDLLISGNNSVSGNTLYGISSTGALDTAFGTNGLVTPPVTGQVAVQPNGGKFDVTGAALVEQFTANGTPDLTFGNYLTPGVASISSYAAGYSTDLALQPDGNLILASTGGTTSLGVTILGFDLARVLTTKTSGADALAPPPTPPASLDGSVLTNPALYLISTGSYAYDFEQNSTPLGIPDVQVQIGLPGVGQSLPTAADYLGSGRDQVAVYLPGTGTYVIKTGIGAGYAVQIGTSGAGNSIPAPADYEGVGRADIAVYQAVTGTFNIRPSDGSALRILSFGTAGQGQSIPAPADYYGTGQADIAVYLAQAGAFAVQDPTGKTPGKVTGFGMPGLGKSLPVPGDYDGSGHVELAVYIPSLGAFFYRPTAGGHDVEVAIGTPNSGELPVVGDYDGSGHDEFAIYDPTRGFLAYQPAKGGADVILAVGSANDGSIPIATPSGDLPVFNGSGLEIKPGGFAPSVAIQGSKPSASTTGFGVTRSSAVPIGPNPGSIRLARSLVNQAITNSSSV